MNFWEVYYLTNNGYVAPIMALGVREFKDKNPDTGKAIKGVEFLTTGEQGHRIVGEPKDGGEGVFTIQDEERTLDGKTPVAWKFEPITMDLWKAMGERGAISGFDRLSTQIADRGTLLNFYLSNFLSDYWTETQEAG